MTLPRAGLDLRNPYGDVPGVGAPQGQQPPKPLTFADKAELAFRQGREKDGIQYLYAHALTGDDAAAKEVLGKMGWIGPLKKPAMAVRWGIAIEYTVQKGYKGSAYPVGTTQNLATKGARRRGGRRSPDGGTRPATGRRWGCSRRDGGWRAGQHLLQQLTGELGQKVLQQLQQRIAKGDFGKVYASAGKTAAPDATGAMPGRHGRPPET